MKQMRVVRVSVSVGVRVNNVVSAITSGDVS